VDIAGNKSAPSAAASSTALLIDDAHISDLTVTKVTAGTISADWIVGARIKTADSGARVELSSLGVQTYNSVGTRTFFADSATGNVSIIGEVATGPSGRRIVINPSNSGEAVIRFYNADGSDFAFINAWGDSGQANIGLQSGADPSSNLSVLKLAEDRVDFGRFPNGSGTPSGGYVILTDAQAVLSMPVGGQAIATSTQWISGTLGGTSATNSYWQHLSLGGASLIGRVNFGAGSNLQALIFDKVDFSSGAGAHTITYGPTMNSTTVPVVTYYDGNGTLCRWQVTASSTTSFSVTTEFATGSTSFAYIAFR
jgi:hypothetical protein